MAYMKQTVLETELRKPGADAGFVKRGGRVSKFVKRGGWMADIARKGLNLHNLAVKRGGLGWIGPYLDPPLFVSLH